MVNKLNGKKSNAAVVAAMISSFIFILATLITGLVLGLNKRKNTDMTGSVAHYLLVDASESLNRSASALRLCNEPDPARQLCNTALVFAVRAETALECENSFFADNTSNEAFLNDAAQLLHTSDPMKAVEKSQILFDISSKFLSHVRDGEAFVYDGELSLDGGAEGGGSSSETDESDKAVKAAEKLLTDALGADKTEYIGTYNGRLEFNVERKGVPGYAMTEKDRVIEFSFSHSGRGEGDDADSDEASAAALNTAKKCGYDGLDVFSVEVTHNFAVVNMCKRIDGALACDECARAAVVDGEVVAFSAGKCDSDHEVPRAKFDEKQARRAAPKGYIGKGQLVTRKVDGRERICYEYTYNLEDGVHYVYVCAENGRQMQVK